MLQQIRLSDVWVIVPHTTIVRLSWHESILWVTNVLTINAPKLSRICWPLFVGPLQGAQGQDIPRFKSWVPWPRKLYRKARIVGAKGPGNWHSGKKRHININLFGQWPSAGRDFSRSGVPGSKIIYVISSEPKEHKSFRPGIWLGSPVTRVTEQSLMCQSFMCLFCSLNT